MRRIQVDGVYRIYFVFENVCQGGLVSLTACSGGHAYGFRSVSAFRAKLHQVQYTSAANSKAARMQGFESEQA